MRISIDVDTTASGLGHWLVRALSGMHPSTNAACELHDALRALSREIPARGISDAQVTEAVAEHGTIAGAARALGIARSTVRARLVRLALEAKARASTAANDTAAAGRQRAG